MLEKLIKEINFKWWTSLEAQQKLTVMMAGIIMVLVSVIGSLFWLFVATKNEGIANVETMRMMKNQEIALKDIQIAAEKARGDACFDSQIITTREQNERYEGLFLDFLDLKYKVNEKTKR